MSQVTAPVILDETGKQIVEKLHTQNLLLDIMAGATLEHTNNLDEIARIVRSGEANKVFGIGDQIILPWTDVETGTTYSMPFDVVHFGNVEIEDGEEIPGMIIQAHYAHPFGVQFSHQRAFLACPDGLTAGTYYFTFEKAWGKNVQAGDVVCFTLTQDVPAGGRIAGCYGAPDQTKSNWRIYSYGADGKELIETVTPTFTASGTDLGTVKQNQRTGNLNSAEETAYGCNNWKISAMLQYLNSTGAKGDWWTPQDSWDIVPDQHSQKAAFLAGFDNDIIMATKPIKVSQATNTPQDGGVTEDTFCRFFLPSLQELNCQPQAMDQEGAAWEYWKRVSGSETLLPTGGSYTYPQMRVFGLENKNAAQNVRLRSAYRGNAHVAWYVGASGVVYSNYASGAYRFAPACAIC